MEGLLHYVWKYKLYDPDSLVTTDGLPIQIIDCGITNTDAGPDFFNAKIKINHTLWAGCVEIHDRASDWFRHHHETDKAYDTVILHVTKEDDASIFRTNGEAIPQLVLQIPENLLNNINLLLREDLSIPCLPYLKEIEPLHLSSWMGALIEERLERKTKDIEKLLIHYNNDWNEVFYVLLTRSFGFGINSDAFEWLAKSLPFSCIRKQRMSHSQIEAMLFGQAGMLNETGDCSYYRLLQREYRFLQKKFNLKPLQASLFKNLRVRPGNFPYQRLAQLSAIWFHHDTLFSSIIENNEISFIRSLLRVPLFDYWNTHYHFRYASPPKEKLLGEDSLNSLMINTVVPLLFTYGLQHHQTEYCDRAINLLENLSAEKNVIIHTFSNAGIKVKHAGDTQALIQLKRAYCEQKKCLYCRIGFHLLKRGILSPLSP